MSVLKPRSRAISIRLSDEEYLGLKQLSVISGARSVSDLTRDAMRVVLSGVNREEVMSFQLKEVRTSLRNLHRKVDQLTRGITALQSKQ